MSDSLVKDVVPQMTPRYCAKCGKPLVVFRYELGRYDVDTGARVTELTGRCPESTYRYPHADLGGEWHTFAVLRREKP